jgi:hypothetical protein
VGKVLVEELTEENDVQEGTGTFDEKVAKVVKNL